MREDGFGAAHLPWGSVELPDGRRTLAVRLGDEVLDVAGAARAGLVPGWLDLPDLDGLLARRAADWSRAREAVRQLVLAPDGADRPQGRWHALDDVTPRLPWTVGDYVDFYASEAHATHVGELFRPEGPALPDAWRHVPLGYHGRAGTVVVDGTPVVRPHGVRADDDGPAHGPCARLDFELELGWVVGGPPTRPGDAVPIDAVEDHLFGVVLLDDWSARDLQAFESRPLGPFLGKSFATTVGAWVTPLDALQGAKVPAPTQDPVPHDGLQLVGDWGLDLALRVELSTEASRAAGAAPATVARGNAASLYWSPAQQLAHMASNGATVRPGDLFGTGTISGWGEQERGCLLERTRGGAEPVPLPWGEQRTWLEDGDEVVLRARSADGTVELAPAGGRVSPARRAAAA